MQRREVLLLFILWFAFGSRVYLAAQTSDGNFALGGSGDFSLGLATRSVPEIVVAQIHDVHPPLYFLLLHYWILAAGKTAFAAKFLSFLANILGVALLYRLGKDLSGWAMGALAALLLTFSSMHTANMVVLRDYVPTLTLALLSLWAFLRLCDGSPAQGRLFSSPIAWVYVLSSVAALYSSYFFVPLLAGQWIYALWQAETRRPLWFWLRVFGLVTLGYLPWIVGAATILLGPLGAELARRQEALPPLSLEDFLRGSLLHLTSNEFALSVNVGVILLLYGGIVILGLPRLWPWPRSSQGPKESAQPGLRYAGLLLFGLALYLTFSYFAIIYWNDGAVASRFLVLGLGYFLLLMAWPLAILARRSPFIFGCALGGVVVLFFYGSDRLVFRPPLPASVWNPTGLVRYLQERTLPGDGLIFLSMGQAGYYESLARPPLPWYYILRRGDVQFEPDVPRQMQEVLPRALKGHPRLWLILYGGNPPQNQPITRWLNQNAAPLGHDWLSDTLVYAYATVPLASQKTPLAVAFQGGIQLRSAAFPSRGQRGQYLPLTLYWETSRPIDPDYKVFVHLVDQWGKRWSQHDAEPQNGSAPTSGWAVGVEVADNHGLALPTNLPLGRYGIEVGLYLPERRLDLVRGGNTARLGTVEIHD